MKTIKIKVHPSTVQADIQAKGDKANLNLNGSVTYSPLDCSTTINQTVKDTITRSGHYEYTYNRLEYTGLDSVVLDVNVPSDQLPTQDKSVVYNENGEYSILPDDGYVLSGVDVSVALDTSIYYEEGRVVGKVEGYNQGWNEGIEEGIEEGIAQQKAKLTHLDVSMNGYYSSSDGFADVSVNIIAPEYSSQSKSVVITQNGEIAVLPDASYDGLSRVDISTNIDTSIYYQQGYSQGQTDGYNSGYTQGETDGYNSGYEDGSTAGIAYQKSLLDSSTFTSNGEFVRENGWNNITVNVPSTPPVPTQSKSAAYTSNGEYTVLPDQGYNLSQVDVSVHIDTQEYYDQGYEDGSTAGIAYQKSLLDSSTFTSNGEFVRENGWRNITVAVPMPTYISQHKNIVVTSNSQQTITPDAGYDGMTSIDLSVNVPSTPPVPTQSKSVSYDQNGEYTVTPDQGYNLSHVDVSVNINTQEYYDQGYEDGSTAGIAYQKSLLDSSTFTVNGQYSRENGWGTVTVNVPSTPPVPTQTKSVTYTVNDTYNVYPDSGYNLSGVEVTVNVPSSPGGSLQTKTTDASVNSITVTPDASYYGLSEVTVNGVDASIDLNIQPENIKEGVTILGVEGTMSPMYNGRNQAKVADSSTVLQTITYDSPDYTGLRQVTINPYTLETVTIDSSTEVQVITPTINYDGLEQVTVNPYVLDSKTVDASTSDVVVTSSEDGLESVTVRGVTASIDPNITPENIKAGVNILGVTGELTDDTQVDLQDKTVTPSNSLQTITADSSYDGLGTVYVNPAPTEILTADASTSLQTITPSVGHIGFSQVTVNPYSLQTKTAEPSTNQVVLTPDSGYEGLAEVTIAPIALQSKTVAPSTSQQIIAPDSSYDGLENVVVSGVTASIDNNIQPQNIVEGVTILGVQGTYSSPSTDEDGYEEIWNRLRIL